MRLTQPINRAVATCPDSVAVIDGDVTRLWGEVYERVARGAGALDGVGVSEELSRPSGDATAPTHAPCAKKSAPPDVTLSTASEPTASQPMESQPPISPEGDVRRGVSSPAHMAPHSTP